MSTKVLVRSAILLTLATVLSFLTLFKMPMGGSATPFSMLFIVLIGYYYGPKVGLTSAFTYGLLRLILGGYIYTLPQALIDYIFASTALAFGAFYRGKSKYRLQIVYTIGVLGLYLFACLSGYLFFGQYAPEGMSTIVYTITYNASYVLPEYIVTMIVISIPTFRNLIDKFATT